MLVVKVVAMATVASLVEALGVVLVSIVVVFVTGEGSVTTSVGLMVVEVKLSRNR